MCVVVLFSSYDSFRGVEWEGLGLQCPLTTPFLVAFFYIFLSRLSLGYTQPSRAWKEEGRGMPTILRPDKKLVSKNHEEIMRELLLDRIYYRVQRYYFYYY